MYFKYIIIYLFFFLNLEHVKTTAFLNVVAVLFRKKMKKTDIREDKGFLFMNCTKRSGKQQIRKGMKEW